MSPRSGWTRHPLVERLGYYLQRVRAWSRRATWLGLGLRALVWSAGTAALVLATPPTAAGVVLPVAAALAVLPAALPHRGWVLGYGVAVVGMCAVRVASPAPAPLLVVATVGMLLYVTHTAAALTAQLRTDAVVPSALVWHWAIRTGLALLGAAAVGVAVLGLPVPAWSATALVLAGAAAVLAVVTVLGWAHYRAAGR